MVIGSQVSSQHFMFHRDLNCFTAEASMVGRQVHGRLYDDACDVGFVMVSAKTRQKAEFYLCEDETVVDDRESEITGWKFRPTDATVRRMPALRGTYVSVFNT